MRIDPRDKMLWVVVSLGVPAVVALGVLGWGTYATNVNVAPPDPKAAAIIGISPQGNPVPLAPTLPPPAPTPAKLAGYHRVEGVIVDELGLPLPDSCIAIGPKGCVEHSPRTDARGVWYFDFPPADVEYELHFMHDGFRETVKRIKPSQDLVLNIVLTH